MDAMETWCRGGEKPIMTLDEIYQGLGKSLTESQQKRKEWQKFADEIN